MARYMQKQRATYSIRDWRVPIFFTIGLIIVCFIVIFLILKFLGPNIGLTFATIAYCIFTTIFIVATFLYQWVAGKRLQQLQQFSDISSVNHPQGILGSP